MDQHTARLHDGCREGGVYFRRKGRGLKWIAAGGGMRSGYGNGMNYSNLLMSAHTHTHTGWWEIDAGVWILKLFAHKHTIDKYRWLWSVLSAPEWSCQIPHQKVDSTAVQHATCVCVTDKRPLVPYPVFVQNPSAVINAGFLMRCYDCFIHRASMHISISYLIYSDTALFSIIVLIHSGFFLLL